MIHHLITEYNAMSWSRLIVTVFFVGLLIVGFRYWLEDQMYGPRHAKDGVTREHSHCRILEEERESEVVE